MFESVIYGICHEDATRTQADAAMEAFRTGFFDWNEVRVSPITEIQGVFESSVSPTPRSAPAGSAGSSASSSRNSTASTSSRC